MRMSKVFTIVAFCALFLLMLSALVVPTTAESMPQSEPIPPSQLHAQFMPALLPAPDISSHGGMRLNFVRIDSIILFAATALVLPTFLTRDANGRVLTAMRYENSYYQVFRQEVAGG